MSTPHSGSAGAKATVKAEGAKVPGQGIPGQPVNKMVERLNELWKHQMHEMQSLDAGSKQDFKHHNDLPLARIKRIMKSDEDVRMISAEAPILFAKACELFILELTARAWCYSETTKRNGLEKDDLHNVLKNTDIFDFLAEVVIHHNDGRRLPGAPPGSTGAGASGKAQPHNIHKPK